MNVWANHTTNATSDANDKTYLFCADKFLNTLNERKRTPASKAPCHNDDNSAKENACAKVTAEDDSAFML